MILKNRFFYFLTLLLAGLSFSSPSQAAVSWKTLAPGLEESTYITRDSRGSSVTLQLYKVEPRKFLLQVVQARDFKVDRIYVRDLVRNTGAVLALNGGFFDPFYKPLGLLVNGGKVLNPLKPISWWAVFSVEKGAHPRIEKLKKFEENAQIEMAVQTGPRLVEDGKPVPTKNNISQKSFIAITPHQEVILGATESGVLDSNDLSKILAEEIKVQQALNLDGGGSTQLYAKLNQYEKEISGFTPVANGIVVIKR
jgi:uncharacterized protein YigE (DUF2233 family)